MDRHLKDPYPISAIPILAHHPLCHSEAIMLKPYLFGKRRGYVDRGVVQDVVSPEQRANIFPAVSPKTDPAAVWGQGKGTALARHVDRPEGP